MKAKALFWNIKRETANVLGHHWRYVVVKDSVSLEGDKTPLDTEILEQGSFLENPVDLTISAYKVLDLMRHFSKKFEMVGFKILKE